MSSHPSDRPLRLLGVGNARSVIFLRWAWRLRELGHDVSVVSDRFSERPGELDGLTLFDIRELGRFSSIRGVRRLQFGHRLAKLATAREIDVVHGHYLLPYGYWAALSGSRPFVLSPWGTDILIDAQRPGRDQARAQLAIAAADLMVVNSAANARAAIGLGADPARIEQIIWYADLDRFGPQHRDRGLRERFGWPDDALIILSLRNFRPDTNIDVVVEAFARVVAREPRARLLLAATSGPLKGEIEALVDKLQLRATVAFHAADEQELPSLIASADVLAAMTKSDSTPSSLLEAMASGLPAVCARAASIDEWIHDGDGGAIVEQRDTVGLADALLELLADPQRRLAYGERNQRMVRETVPAAGPALESAYRRLLAHTPEQAARPALSRDSLRDLLRRIRSF